MSSILLHGKYSGCTYEEVLKKDLAYCQFMLLLKFVKPHFQEFVDWLKVNVPRAEMEERQKRIDALSMTHCM